MGLYKTPLRYPGGKQKISPFIAEIIGENNLFGGQYVEPYAGGAGVAIELLLSGTVSRIHLNDSCPAVYAFWYSILHETEEFCYRISRASLDVKEWKKQREIIRNPGDYDKFDLGFALFFLNRCNRSGIISAGVIGGMDQKGKWKINARFSRNDLIHRIESIARKKHCIRIRNWDAEKYMIQYIPQLPKKTLVYFDPPYYHKSQELYQNHYNKKDHERIAKIIQKKIKNPWMVTYDNTPEILKYYERRKKFVYLLQYSAGRVYQGLEIFIVSDKITVPTSSNVPFINQALDSIHYS